MKRRWLVLLLTLAMLLCFVQVGVLADDTAETDVESGAPAAEIIGSGSAAAETTASGSCGENVTWTLENHTLTISGTGDMEDYDWGDTPWYNYQDYIYTAVIADGVTGIGDDALRDCHWLTSVTIPDSVTSIGEGAFCDCESLTEVTIPDSVTNLGKSVFWGCESLTDVTIGNQVTSLGTRAFINCTALTSVTIPDSVTSIGYAAFAGCTSLKSITFGSGLTTLGDYAFHCCSSLESLTIPDNVTGMGFGVFEDCTGLTAVTLGNGLKGVGSSAFDGCTSLAVVKIGSGATFIGHYAFEDCTSLTSLTIPEGVTTINHWAFTDCTGLQRVTIPASVTEIEFEAFRGCTGLTDVYYAGTADTWNAISIEWGNDILNSAVIHCGQTPPSDSPFIDVQDSSEYYYKPVLWAAENSITCGTGDFVFSPEEGCTRAQVITFLYRAAGSPSEDGTMYFDDVSADAYYYNAVLWGYHHGIVYGTETRKFSPDEQVTRAQFLTFLYRYAHKPQPSGAASPFVDLPSDEYYTKAVLWGYENKIVYGTDNTHFSPEETCTRAQVVTFLYRYLAK